jgi:hypothetical protein
MSELNVTADQFAGLTPDGQASLEASLSKAGASAEYLASLKGGKTAAPAEKPAALPFANGKPATADPSLLLPATQAGHLSYETKLAAFQKMQGIVPDEQIAAAAKAEGINPADLKIAAPAEPEKLTLAQANERLAATSGPLAASQSPSDHSFTLDRQFTDGLEPNEVADIDAMFRTALHGATIPISLGQGIVSEAMRAANLYEGMSPEQATMKYAEEGAKLRRLGNVDQITANGEYAWARLPNAFQEAATKDRLFHTADAYNALANAGAAMKARDARQGKK